jgi:GlcNAc-P-P-Und epimerase
MGNHEENAVMKVLVTGNSGFIGTVLVDRLLQAGHVVRGMDIRPPARPGAYQHIIGDIRVPADVRRAVEGMDLVVSLAAEHKDFGITEEAYFAVNDQGTRNLVEAAAAAKVTKVMFYSSVAVYGDPGGQVTEETTPKPKTHYGRSKWAGEQHMLSWSAADATRSAVIVRPCVVFGPNNFANMYNLIHTIARRRFVMVGSGTHVKSVAYVDNLVAATLFLIDGMRPGAETYNYSDNPQTPVGDLVRSIATHLGIGAPKVRLPLRPVLAVAQVVDLVGRLTGYDFPITGNRIRKLNTPTVIVSERVRQRGFSQKIGVDDAVKATVAWYRARHAQRKASRPATANAPALTPEPQGPVR